MYQLKLLLSVYVTLPGTILHIFSKYDGIKRENISSVWYVFENLCLCVFVVYSIKSENTIDYKKK